MSGGGAREDSSSVDLPSWQSSGESSDHAVIAVHSMIGEGSMEVQIWGILLLFGGGGGVVQALLMANTVAEACSVMQWL